MYYSGMFVLTMVTLNSGSFIYVTFKMSVDFSHSTSASQRKTG